MQTPGLFKEKSKGDICYRIEDYLFLDGGIWVEGEFTAEKADEILSMIFLNGLDSEVYRYAIKILESTHCDNWRYVIYYDYKHKMRGDDMDIAKSIRDLRESTGMSRKEFSEHTGIPVRTLEDWEAGRRTPPEYIPRLIAYQLKFEELMKVKGEKLL